MNRSLRFRLPVTILMAGSLAIAAPMLTGCSLIGSVVNGATGGGGLPGGLPGGQVPSDFPSEVPLIDGDVVFGLALGDEADGRVWNVTIKVGGADAFDSIKSDLEGAGFESKDVASSAEGTSAAFSKGDLLVLMVVSESDGEWTANYTVTRASE